MKKLLFEIISFFERLFIDSNIRTLSDSKLVWIGHKDAKHLICLCGSILASGGSGTALRLASSVMARDDRYAVVMERAKIKNISDIMGLFCGEQCYEIVDSSRISNVFESVVYTNWQSYYKFSFLEANNRFMFVQDGEYWFFPKGGIFYYALAPYSDESVIKICLGDWLVQSLELARGPMHSILFPTTLKPTKEIRCAREKDVLNVLVYVKHSFRRAGGVLLTQLQNAQLKVCDVSVRYSVIGYKPSLFLKFLYPKNVNFLGYVDEERMCVELEGCDLGVVYSCTNVSLLPFQLAAYGKPVIELKGGGAEINQLEAALIFVPCNYGALEAGLVDYLRLRENYDSEARSFKAKVVSINDSANGFSSIIESYSTKLL